MEYRVFALTDESRIPEICELFRKGLGDTESGYWKWKHFSENGLPKGVFAAAETEEGKLAGMFPMQPSVYRCGEKRLAVVKPQDLVIDFEHRGKGLMKKLFSFAAEYYGNDNMSGLLLFCNDNAYPIYLKYGARDAGDIASIRTKKRLLPIYCRKERKTVHGWELCIADEMPADLFFSGSDDVFRMEKNEAFMYWKFVQNPEEHYRWLTIRKDGQLKGYLVFYIVQGRYRRAVNIADWDLDETVSEEMLYSAVKLLQTHGNWVSLWGRYSEAAAHRWAKAGLCINDGGHTHFVLYDYHDALLPENWHITRADIDF